MSDWSVCKRNQRPVSVGLGWTDGSRKHNECCHGRRHAGSRCCRLLLTLRLLPSGTSSVWGSCDGDNRDGPHRFMTGFSGVRLGTTESLV